MIEQRQDKSDSPTQEDGRHSVDMVRANLLGVGMAILPVLFLVFLHGLLHGWSSVGQAFEDFCGNLLVFLPAMLAGIFLHELIHALAWGMFSGRGLRSVRMGFQWKTMTPFAHCLVPITARSYRLGAAMPGFLVGLLPALTGSFTGMHWLASFGWFMTFCAGGDLLVLVLLRGVPADALVEDHPTRAGCRVVESPGLG